MKIGVIGCGAIGSVLCKFIDQELKEHKLVAVCDINKQIALRVKKSLKSNPSITSIDKLIATSDLIIEAVDPIIVGSVLKKCIQKKKHLMVMSVGGLIQNISLLKKLSARLFIPSGAICGIDGLKAANIEQVQSVTLTTTKNPKGLKDAPFVRKNKINLKKKRVIFEGSALEAIEGFPNNINVAATLSLAGIGPKNTKVRIISDPKAKRNVHEIEVIGSFGKFYTRTENTVSPLNPKTSHMAVLSACATLKRLTGKVKLGN